jgi:hypothetical protein
MQNIINYYLTKNGYLDKVKLFNNNYLSHPNYPSLLAVTDSLSFIGLENIAAKVPFIHIEQLPNVFIIELDLENKTLYILEKHNDGFNIIDENEKTRLISFSELEKIWTGVVLIIEENEQIQKTNPFKYFNLIALLILITIITIYSNECNVVQSIFLFISLIGVYVTFEIVKTYFQENNATESKFCAIKKEFSCNATIKSKNYAFSKYLEFVDLPVFFFSFAFFGLLFSIVSISTIGILSTFSIPIIAYSLYIQKKVLKKWCVLCLLISLLLIAYSFLFFYFEISSKLIIINEISWFISIVAIWFFIKKLLLNKEENKNKINSLLRFKRNEDVFNAISKDVIDSKTLETLPKLSIGNTNATNILTLFLSPSCPHCHTSFKQAIELIEMYPDIIKVEIAYNLNINNLENPYLDIAKMTMQLYNQKKDYKQALVDWHIKRIEIEAWKRKWNLENDFLVENEQLDKQFLWCVANEFNYAPVKFFNGKLIPQVYEIDELFYFFKEEN